MKAHEQLATLTWADVDRLQAASGRAVEAVSEWEWLDEGGVARWAQVHPTLGPYFGPVSRRLTLKRRNGACVFHGARGCTLTSEQRPTACRLYPFEVRAHGQWGLQVDRFDSLPEAIASGGHACLAVEEADSFEALWEALGTTREELQALAERQRVEARDHHLREQALHRSDPR